MPSSSEHPLAVLGLSAGATVDEIKQAFRDLAQVWHPDRFAHDARLRAKAEDKFKQINAAYQTLMSPSRNGGVQSTAASTSSGAQQPRFVRMALPGVPVAFDGRRGRLINLSISGGQLLIDVTPRVGSHAPLVLQADSERLELDAYVVRISPPSGSHPANSGIRESIVSIKFVNLSPRSQRAIPRFYNLLLDRATSNALR